MDDYEIAGDTFLTIRYCILPLIEKCQKALDRIRAENAEMRKALEWYEHRLRIWEHGKGTFSKYYDSRLEDELFNDGGERARRLLEKGGRNEQSKRVPV